MKQTLSGWGRKVQKKPAFQNWKTNLCGLAEMIQTNPSLSMQFSKVMWSRRKPKTMSAIWGSLILRCLSLASGSVMKQLKLDSEVSSYLMATVNVVFLQLKLENHNLASWVQPFDQGIICSFKGIYCKFHVRWILDMLDSQVFRNASQARVDVRTAIEWTRTAWDDLSANLKTVKNCWNHAKILPGSACSCSRYRTRRCCTEGACYSAAASAGSWNAG